MAGEPKLSFWAHQAAEYLLGLFLFLSALRLVGRPMILAFAAGLVFTALAAFTRGPLAAFQLLSRSAHRALDVGFALFLAASPLLLGLRTVGTIVLAEGLAVAVATLVRRTAYVEAPRRTAPRGGSSATLNTAARTAGTLLGRAGQDAPRRLGRFVGRRRHNRP